MTAHNDTAPATQDDAAGYDPTALRALRQRLGLSQEDCAHRIGVTVASWNRWEAGVTKPSRLARRALDALRDAGGG